MIQNDLTEKERAEVARLSAVTERAREEGDSNAAYEALHQAMLIVVARLGEPAGEA